MGLNELDVAAYLSTQVGVTQNTHKPCDTQDQTSQRVNTLSDNADDIQKQLDNEARDRIKFGRPKTIWVFHFPNHESDPTNNMECPSEPWTRSMREFALLKSASLDDDNVNKAPDPPPPPPIEDWNYKLQNEWYETYPECGGRSQSPVNLPIDGLVKAKVARRLYFGNYNVMPLTMTLVNDGKRITLFGKWPKQRQPLVHGGAAYSRRYVFHSLNLHWPSEHTVGGLRYPMESQVIHISAEYKSLNEALQASPNDPQALLAISNMYKFSNETQSGLAELIFNAVTMRVRNTTIEKKPLSFFNPPFKEYACYHGSLPIPPCTESVLWFVRGRTLAVMRQMVDATQRIFSSKDVSQQNLIRQPQPLNDRKVYLFS